MLTTKPRRIFPSRGDDSIRGGSEPELRKHGVESCGNGRDPHRHPAVLEETRGIEGNIKTIKNHPGVWLPKTPFLRKWPV